MKRRTIEMAQLITRVAVSAEVIVTLARLEFTSWEPTPHELMFRVTSLTVVVLALTLGSD